jgi:sugar phosphate isomerase/epimerase
MIQRCNREEVYTLIKGLTRAGLGNIGSDEQFIRLAGQYGFGAVDIDAKGIVGDMGLDNVKALLEETGIVIGAGGFPVEWRKSEKEFQEGLELLKETAKLHAALQATSCVTYILPSADEPPAIFMARSIRRLRECAQVLEQNGLKFGLEFVGPHHLRSTWMYPFIWTVDETLEMINAIGTTNVGLLIDSYHTHTTGFDAEKIRGLKASQIVHAHINDARDVAVAEVRDNDRIYPGEGVIDLAGYLGALKDIGYEGVVAQEVLTPEPPTDSPETLLARSKAGFDKLFAAI